MLPWHASAWTAATTSPSAGPITFKNNRDLRDALAVTPLDRVLVETDAPYLTPHPWRGATNSPALVPLTVRVMAGVLGVAVPTLCEALSDNAERLYGPWSAPFAAP
jgi:TatD DNase family protein